MTYNQAPHSPNRPPGPACRELATRISRFDKTARLWDATTGRQQLQVTHDNEVSKVAFSPNGTQFATNSGKTAQTWDAATGRQQLQFTHNAYVTAVAFSPEGTRLATGSFDKTARIWDIVNE